MRFTVYSDGSGTTGGPAGIAFVALDERGASHLESEMPLKDATNHRAEILAACFALRELPAGSDIVVWSDSEYLVKGWNEWLPAWRKNDWRKKGGVSRNRPYWERLIVLVDRHALVEFRWLRSHDGHEHNERADRLARHARAGALAAPDEASDGV
jgi:ribonuclease HI